MVPKLLFSVCVPLAHIGIDIPRVYSAVCRQKAFYTCNTHLKGFLCAYRHIMIISLQHTPNHMLGDMMWTLSNIVSPMLNSLIYSGRTKSWNILKERFQRYNVCCSEINRGICNDIQNSVFYQNFNSFILNKKITKVHNRILNSCGISVNFSMFLCLYNPWVVLSNFITNYS